MEKDTKYNMVKEYIMQRITEGAFTLGDKIYSENELVKILKVSRHTVRKAIDDLVHEGWLYKEQGSGTYCLSKNGFQTVDTEQKYEIKTTITSNTFFERPITHGDLIVFTYTNYKGETSERRAVIKDFIFGSNDWHKENQLMVKGFDLDKLDYRMYAAKDISKLSVIPVK